jgi:tryptophan synthase beta chain
MIRDFQRVIGVEARRQILERAGRLPDAAVACVGGGSNAIGLFHAFLPATDVRLIGCEAAGHGVETGKHAATLSAGEPGILHGSRSYVLQDDEGQITEPWSISAGLDYAGVGPEHAYLHDTGRGEYRPVTDAAAMRAFRLLASTEGIIPAIESAHALAGAIEVGTELGPDGLILVNLSGSTAPSASAASWPRQAAQDVSCLTCPCRSPRCGAKARPGIASPPSSWPRRVLPTSDYGNSPRQEQGSSTPHR